MQLRKIKAIRNVAIFLVVILICLISPSIIRNFTHTMFSEFRAPLDALPSQLNDLAKFWSLKLNSKKDLIEAGRDLARLNSAYELKNIENEALKSNLNKLEDILNLTSYDKFKMEIARVCRRDLNAWWQNIVIRKGSMHGIQKGYAVIFNGGVVGRISEVNQYTSVVELVSSRKFRMATKVIGDERPIIYQGEGAISLQNAQGQVTGVASDVQASTTLPLKLVTQSLAGSFPDGLPIGEIVSLKLGADGIFKSGNVILSSGLSNITEVAVLIPIGQTKGE